MTVGRRLSLVGEAGDAKELLPVEDSRVNLEGEVGEMMLEEKLRRPAKGAGLEVGLIGPVFDLFRV